MITFIIYGMETDEFYALFWLLNRLLMYIYISVIISIHVICVLFSYDEMLSLILFMELIRMHGMMFIWFMLL